MKLGIKLERKVSLAVLKSLITRKYHERDHPLAQDQRSTETQLLKPVHCDRYA
jgi:hypothetical protein